MNIDIKFGNGKEAPEVTITRVSMQDRVQLAALQALMRTHQTLRLKSSTEYSSEGNERVVFSAHHDPKFGPLKKDKKRT